MDDPPILPSLDPTEVERTLYRRRDAPESLQPLQINYTNTQYYAENISNQSAPVTNKNVLLDANIRSNSARNHSLASNNTTATAHIESTSNHSSRHSSSIHSPVQPVPGTLMTTQTDIVPKLDLLTNPSDKNGDALSSNKSPASIGRISSQCSPVGSMDTAAVATALFDESISLAKTDIASATESISTAYNKTDIVQKIDSLTDSGDKNSDALSSNNSPTNGGPVSSETKPTLYPRNYVDITLKAHIHADMRKALETGLRIMFLYFIFYVNNIIILMCCVM